jgi:hypothetical protein
VAVVPFENLSHNRNAGLILTDLATTLLYGQDRFRVIEVSQVARTRTSIAPTRSVSVGTANGHQHRIRVRGGAALEADWVLVGSVGEYGFVDGFGETANVGMTLRLVRVEDREGGMGRIAVASGGLRCVQRGECASAGTQVCESCSTR